MSGDNFRNLPRNEAGCRMPTFEGIDRAEQAHRSEAEIRNERFVEALGRYFDNGGRA